MEAQVEEVEIAPVRLDLGCGKNKREGFLGVDKLPFPEVDFRIDLGNQPWSFADNSVDEAHTSHFVEHLTSVERCHFFNELHRVLKPKAQCSLIVPHWSSCRAYGDPTHQWPPMGEFFFFYLKREWRATNAPHTDKEFWSAGYDCDFDSTWGYGVAPSLQQRNQEFQQFACNYYKEATLDLHVTLTKRE